MCTGRSAIRGKFWFRLRHICPDWTYHEMGNQKQRRRRYGGGGQSVFLRKDGGQAEDTERRALLEGWDRPAASCPRPMRALTPPGPGSDQSYVFEINALRPGTPTCCGGSRELDGRRRRSQDNCRGTRRQGTGRGSWEGWRWKPCSMPSLDCGQVDPDLLLAALRRPLE